MQAGSIVETGTHQSLMQSGRIYPNLYKSPEKIAGEI